jgi:hypothetical protein
VAGSRESGNPVTKSIEMLVLHWLHFSVGCVCAVFVLLVVCTFLNIGSDLILYILELVVSSYEFYGSGNTRISMYWIVVVLSDDLFL